MESTLHRQLKQLYADDDTGVEVVVDGYRIDAISEGRLIEIQAASLSSLAPKVKTLVRDHAVTVVKPLPARNFLIKRQSPRGDVLSQRFSPKRATPMHLFEDLVHFVGVFPHRNLRLELLMIHQEEHRVPKRARRRFRKDYRVTDRVLKGIDARIGLTSPADLLALLPELPPAPFTTKDLAECCGIPRWLAQKAAYCLRKTEAIEQAGKQGHSLAYSYPQKPRRRRRAS